MNFAFVSSFAEGKVDGDSFTSLIGKSAEHPEVKNLIADYKMEMANNQRYQSKDGIEMVLKNGIVEEIHLVKSSTAFGSFGGTLPAKLKFGMTANEVKGLLGKPETWYTSSGYGEYNYNGLLLSCWFEGGTLTQVVISPKA